MSTPDALSVDKGPSEMEDKTVKDLASDQIFPGTDEDHDNEKSVSALDDNYWHDFESQYSMALAQSAIIEREQWSSNVEFLLSCISSAVGLGNIWRFPFVCGKNGGGAFLIPYLVVVCLIGRPLYYLELSLGQFSSRGSVKVWEMVPILRGIGYGTGLASFLVTTFYVTIMAWTTLYMAYSVLDPFPWNEKDLYKDTEDFFERGILKEIIKNTTGNTTRVYDLKFKQGKGLGPPSWEQMLALLASWIVVWLALVKGVSGSGKVAYFTAIFPYCVMAVLLAVACSLDGASAGMLYFVKPKWELILEPKTWFEAVNQCFFSLGVGFGGCVMFSSFNHFNHNLGRDVLIISVVDTLTSFLAGITMFGILGNLALEANVDVAELAKSGGPSLAFISYPRAMSEKWPYPCAQILSFLFFVMLLTLGIGSATALAGTTITIFTDCFPNIKKWIIVTINCFLGFIGGIIYCCPAGGNIIDIVNDFGAGFVIYVFAFMEISGIVFIYGLKNYCNDLEFMLGRKVNLYWTITWLLLPFLLVVIFLFYMCTFKVEEKWHISAQAAGWVLAVLVLIVPIIFAFRSVQSKKSSKWHKRFVASLYPTRRWGPKDPIIKEAWRRFRRTRATEFEWTIKLKKILHCRRSEVPDMSTLQSQATSKTNVQSAAQSGLESNAEGSGCPTVIQIDRTKADVR